MSSPLAHRVSTFGVTIFSEMSRLAVQHNAVNLGQGFPDFDGPEPAKDAAIAAIRAGENQYAPGIGTAALRQAIARHARRFYGQAVDPETEVTVASGATEAMFSAVLGLVNPGDEVVIFEPYYDSYVPQCLMAGAVPRLVPLRARADGAWAFDEQELAAAFNARTRLIILNTPHNPTGKVFTEAELRFIAGLCQQWNTLALSDEVYEHLVYTGARHVRLAALPGMAERTVTLGSSGKIFNFTGWKVGWAIAPPALTTAVRRAHQYVTFATATPLQSAVAAALDLDDEYYQALAADYERKRDFLAGVLAGLGLRISRPQGTYFIMTDISPLGFDGDDVAFSRWLTTEIGVAAIPASAMYAEAAKPLARDWVRFAFCKRAETLERAAERLQRLRRG